MTFARALARLWRHHDFRRLLLMRILSQGGDATVQLGMASYILFSPQSQPNALAIATMLAVTLLPFSLVGPFVSVVPDRWSRRRVSATVDATRVVLALVIAGLVLSGHRGGWATIAFYALLLVAMSLSRFVLAAQAAAIPHTVAPDEYLSASSVSPAIGPIAAGIAGLGLVLRIGLVRWGSWTTTQADTLLFALAAVSFAAAVVVALRFAPGSLGPVAAERRRATGRELLGGIRAAAGQLRRQPPAAITLATLIAQRVLHGLIQVAVVLLFRNRFAPGNAGAALAGIAIWAGLTGLGFAAAVVGMPPLVRRLGMRRAVVAVLLLNGVLQAVPGSWFAAPTVVAAGFGLGACAQALKIATDAVVQAHVDDAVRGRVFVLYDIVLNLATVAAGFVGVAVLPVDGASLPVFLGVAVGYAVLAAAFAAGTRRYGDALDRGAESVIGARRG